MKLSAAQTALLAKIRNSEIPYAADLGHEPASALVLERLGLISVTRVSCYYERRRPNGDVKRIKDVALVCKIS